MHAAICVTFSCMHMLLENLQPRFREEPKQSWVDWDADSHLSLQHVTINRLSSALSLLITYAPLL